MIRKTLLALTLGAVALGASSCNMVRGLGEDIQSVGRAGEEAIN
jgi:entericidin B